LQALQASGSKIEKHKQSGGLPAPARTRFGGKSIAGHELFGSRGVKKIPG
jgi:hypothetical protein